MTFGQQVFDNEAVRMLEAFSSAGGTELDSAYVYNDGACEKLLGTCFKKINPTKFSLATKVNPRVSGRLDGEAVRTQLAESLQRMDVDQVDILYLHFPDPATPLEEPLAAIADLYADGLIRELGVSNYSKSMLLQTMDICDKKNWLAPSVYEGVYNALSRNAEYELMPCLGNLNMRFYAYNPLAGGLLSGKYFSKLTGTQGGRFDFRPGYKDRYWKESYFSAIERVSVACDHEGISLIEAAYIWLIHHSRLDAERDDGIIIGASRLSQLEQNLTFFGKEPLPQGIQNAFEDAWELTKNDAPPYFRNFASSSEVR